jgi:hypothetical protein
VTGPVLGLIDSICQQLNYWPVPARPVPETPACNDPQPAAPAAQPESGGEPEPVIGGMLADAGQPSVA